MGEEVSQAGSLVNFERLRFDFNAPRSPTAAELAELESLVNGWIGDAVDVGAEEMAIADAKAKGATAMFGEKYGDVVRVVDVPGVSMGSAEAPTGRRRRKSAGSRFSPRRAAAARASDASKPPRDRASSTSSPRTRGGVVTALAGALRVPPEEITGRVSSIQDDLRAAQKEAERFVGNRRREIRGGVADAVATSADLRACSSRGSTGWTRLRSKRRRNRSRRRSRARRTRRASRWCSGRDPPTGRLGSSPSLTRARKKPGGSRRAPCRAPPPRRAAAEEEENRGSRRRADATRTKLDEALEAARTTILEALA